MTDLARYCVFVRRMKISTKSLVQPDIKQKVNHNISRTLTHAQSEGDCGAVYWLNER